MSNAMIRLEYDQEYVDDIILKLENANEVILPTIHYEDDYDLVHVGDYTPPQKLRTMFLEGRVLPTAIYNLREKVKEEV